MVVLGLALIGGGVFATMIVSSAHEVASHPRLWEAELQHPGIRAQLSNAARTYGQLSYVGFGLGAIGVIAGVVVLATGPRREGEGDVARTSG